MKIARSDRSRAVVPAVLAALAATCAEEPAPTVPQWLVYIDTDAPVAGSLERAGVPALFDRVRIEIIPDGDSEPCGDCIRVLPLDHDGLVGGLSFGIAGVAKQPGPRVRLRAFRSAIFPDGVPSAQASIDVTVQLQALEDSAKRELTIFLPTAETGLPSTSASDPGVPSEGAPVRSRVATWPFAERVPCDGAPRPGEVCVPGGAFWMPSAALSEDDIRDGVAYDEQLVVLSPYFISATEVTVGTLLRSGFVTTDWSPLDDLAPWSGDEEGWELGSHRDWCTYGGALERQALPVTCVRPTLARAYCRSIGADLPTEAQIAYPMGGFESRRAPWGDEPASCDDAWWGRGGGFSPAFLAGPCSPVGAFQGYRPVATSGRDRVFVEGGAIEDLAGNALELTRDRHATRDAPCWPAGVVHDPECVWDELDETANLVVRGGTLGTLAASEVSTRPRLGLATDTFLVEAGFRCVRPGGDATPAPIDAPAAWIGTGCVADADCSTDTEARCLGPDDDHGIGGGYCSRTCGSDADCPEGSICAAGHCFLRCDVGDPPIDRYSAPLYAGKCHGRRDLACADLAAAPAICYPTCSSDSQCGDRFCDHALGSCSDRPATGLEDGEPCDVDEDCRGACLGGVCASVCSSGGEADTEDCGGSGDGLCVRLDTLGVGDLARCARTCADHGDCEVPSTFCINIFELDDDKPTWWTVAPNACVRVPTCTVEGSSCGAGLVCATTAYGLYCLDPKIPPP